MRYLSDTKSCNATNVIGGAPLPCPKLFTIATGLIFFHIILFVCLPGGIAASIQTQIVEEALGNQFCKANLSLILCGCDSSTDAAGNQSGPNYKHFLDADLLKSVNYMEREKLKILNLSITADTDQTSRALALYHMGLLFHTAQEFYFRSNYLELKLAEFEKSRHVPTSEELYGLDLVDWNSLTTMLRGGGKSNLVVNQLEKGDPNSEESKRKIAGLTYFAVTRELSFRETERQWRQLSSLIRARLPKNGTQVLVALQNAGVPEQTIADLIREQESVHK
jgi:hypothetical protein